MESNIDMNVRNSAKVTRCPLGHILNPNSADSIENSIESSIESRIGNNINGSRADKKSQGFEHTSNSSLSNKGKVILLKITGVFFVGLAILGVVLPILPTTPFLLVAAACFAKSSPEMQKRLLANKTFGPLIHDWQKYRSIPRKAKRIALLTIALSVSWSAFMLQSLWLTVLVVALVTGPFIFLWRLPLSK